MVPRAGTFAVVGILLATGVACSDDEPKTSPTDPSPSASTSAAPSPSATEPTGDARLPLGKDDLEVAVGAHLSPEGFVPELRLDVTPGWTSVHRGADGFDLGMADSTKDAPLVAVVFLSPPEGNAADALSEIEARASGTVTAMPGLIGALESKGIDIVGGTGQVVASAAGGIALDANPDGRMQVYAADVGGKPLVVVIYVPDASRWSKALPAARALLVGTSAD